MIRLLQSWPSAIAAAVVSALLVLMGETDAPVFVRFVCVVVALLVAHCHGVACERVVAAKGEPS